MKSEFNPKISIIIPVYNGSNYLNESIDSALAQTYSNFEVIVVNDGSTDNGATREVALSYGDKIRYFEKENGGVSSALNYGICEMTGEYFSWLSHDDGYEPGKLENSVSYLSTFDNRDKTVVLCGAFYINESSQKIRNIPLDLKKNVRYSNIDVLSYTLKNGAFNACSLLIPKIAFEECGYFNEDLRYNQDALMWYNIFSHDYSLVVDPEQYDVSYRLHANQTSKTRRDLLVRDSFEMAKIIAPTFAKLSTKKINLLKMYAIRNSRHDLKNAVNHCIDIGKKTNVIGTMDIVYIKFRVFCGKCRNVIKKIYHRLRFKK